MLKKIAGIMLTFVLGLMLNLSIGLPMGLPMGLQMGLPMSTAWAHGPSQEKPLVELNRADQAALDGVAGIGAEMSKRILAEREANGYFKDWNDLQKRVKGIGEKSAVKLSLAGLRVEGKPKSPRNVPVMPVETPPAR